MQPRQHEALDHHDEGHERHHGADYLPFVETWHVVKARGADGLEYSACRTTYALRKPFDPATYYGDAIERLPSGEWNTGTAGAHYVADDGFGNLIMCPDQGARPGHYSTAKTVDDCVVGPYTFIPGAK